MPVMYSSARLSKVKPRINPKHSSIMALGLLLVITSLPRCEAQNREMNVYVADFRSASGRVLDSELLTSITEDFESILFDSGSYRMLDRRNLGDLKDALQNEATLRDNPDIQKRLRNNGAEAVFFGRVQDDIESGLYVFYVSLVKLDDSLLWKRTASLRRGLVHDRDSRLETLKKLLDRSSGQEADLTAIQELRWKYQDAMNTFLSTGDTTSLRELFVDKYNKSSPAQSIPPPTSQTQANLVFELEKWEIGKVDDLKNGRATIAMESIIRGQEMGRPVAVRNSGRVNLAKVKGEWLVASGGDIK